MKKYLFQNAKFITTGTAPEHYPTLRHIESGDILPEIAVAGRSNVGKSSLLNHLFQSKSLVKTSSTPGKTQAINFFTVNDELSFVDLPGYGYAKVPPSVKKQWGPMVQGYVNSRDALKLVLFLIDIRRIPNEEDLRLVEWVVHHQKAMILVLTKVDQVKRNEKMANTQKILKTLNCENLHHVHYSSTQGEGRIELIRMIHEALENELS